MKETDRFESDSLSLSYIAAAVQYYTHFDVFVCCAFVCVSRIPRKFMISEQTETAEPAREGGRKKKRSLIAVGGKVSVRETQHIIYTRRKGGTATIAQIMHGPFLYHFSIYLTFYERL